MNECATTHPLSAEELGSLIGLVYEGPLETVPWSSSLRWLTANLRSSWAVLVLRPASRRQTSLMIQACGQEVTVSGTEFSLFERYSMDPFTDLPPNRVMTPEQLLGKEQWYGHPFFRQYLQPNDIQYELGADFRAAQSDCRLRLCRPERSGAYSSAERQIAQALVPHFARAVELHSRLRLTEAERAVLASSFDHLRVGTVILDEVGRALTLSDTARELLIPRHWTAAAGATLEAPDRRTNEELQNRIHGVLAAREGEPLAHAMTVADPGGASALRVLLKTVPRQADVGTQRRPAVVVFLRDALDRLAPSAEVLQMLFDLTPAEARFARLIAAGASMEHAGKRLGITRNTCKSRMRAIFQKTGATRQAALVGVLHDTLVWL